MPEHKSLDHFDHALCLAAFFQRLVGLSLRGCLVDGFRLVGGMFYLFVMGAFISEVNLSLYFFGFAFHLVNFCGHFFSLSLIWLFCFVWSLSEFFLALVRIGFLLRSVDGLHLFDLWLDGFSFYLSLSDWQGWIIWVSLFFDLVFDRLKLAILREQLDLWVFDHEVHPDDVAYHLTGECLEEIFSLYRVARA